MNKGSVKVSSNGSIQSCDSCTIIKQTLGFRLHPSFNSTYFNIFLTPEAYHALFSFKHFRFQYFISPMVFKKKLLVLQLQYPIPKILSIHKNELLIFLRRRKTLISLFTTILKLYHDLGASSYGHMHNTCRGLVNFNGVT